MEKSNARILYIEDYPVIQTMFVEALRNRDFTVDVASDGKTALTLAAENTYDVILLDLMLPDVKGLDFLREFRAKNYPGTVVALSDFDDTTTIEDLKNLGVTHHWVKVDHTPRLLSERLEHLVKDIDEPAIAEAPNE